MPYDYHKYAQEFKSRAKNAWRQAVMFARGQGSTLIRPHQVEIHACEDLQKAGCANDCQDCCGRFIRSSGGMSQDSLLRLYDELIEMKVPSVVLSGAYTDPTFLRIDLLKRLISRGGPTWGIKLYTCGEMFVPLVQKAVFDAAEADPNSDSYLRISKHTTDPSIFERMCRPRNGDAAASLQKQEENLYALFSSIVEKSYSLSVSLNCRLTKTNGKKDAIIKLLNWFGEHAPSSVYFRFTTISLPPRSTKVYRKAFYRDLYMPQDEAKYLLDQAIKDANLVPEQRKQIIFRYVPPEPTHNVPVCFNQLLFASVSTTGQVYPCQAVAGQPYSDLSYGDLAEQSFQTIWTNHMASLSIDGLVTDRHECPQCATECERQICMAFANELNVKANEQLNPQVHIESGDRA